MLPREPLGVAGAGVAPDVVAVSVNRQRLIGIETFTDADGIGRCNLVLGPEVIETAYQPRRAFQGWRYLEDKDAPRDLTALGDGANEMPLELRRELAELGLL